MTLTYNVIMQIFFCIGGFVWLIAVGDYDVIISDAIYPTSSLYQVWVRISLDWTKLFIIILIQIN